MALETIKNLLTSPAGTARLLEGFSSLKRAKEAGLTIDQTRQLFPDLKQVSDQEINGFVDIGNKFITGEVRCPGTAFGKTKKLRPAHQN